MTRPAAADHVASKTPRRGPGELELQLEAYRGELTG